MGAYDDIIHMEHPTSKIHLRMSVHERAAQFSPFAALTGHDAAIQETARLTEDPIELTDTAMVRINRKLKIAEKYVGTQELFTFTYFVPDSRKQGGSYQKSTGSIKKINPYTRRIHLTNGILIEIDSLIDISSG